MTIAQEEIFGPVLSIIPYDTEEEAIEIANDTPYGLSGGVSSGDPARAEKVARQLRTGQVDINGGRLQPERALRRLQAVGYRARARQVRARGVHRDQGDAALRGFDVRPSGREFDPEQGTAALVWEYWGRPSGPRARNLNVRRCRPAGQATVTRPWRHRHQIPTQTNRRR